MSLKDIKRKEIEVKQRVFNMHMDTINEGMRLGFLDEDDFRAMGAIFDEDGSVTGQRDFSQASFDSMFTIAEGVSRRVEGQLEAYHRLKGEHPLRRFADRAVSEFFGFWGSIVGSAGSLETRAARAIGIMDTGPGGATPEEVGRTFRQMFAHPERLIAGGAEPTVTGSLPETPEEFAALPPSLRQQILKEERFREGAGGAGVAGQVLGSLAGVASSFALRPDPFKGLMSFSRTGRLAALADKGLLPGTLGARLTTGGAFVAGLTGFASAPDDADYLERIARGTAGAGAVLFLGTALTGRPTDMVARGIQLPQMSAGFGGKGAAAALRRLRFRTGVALQFNKRMTVGQMSEIGAIGAAITTADYLSQGAPVQDAVYHGVMGGAEWIGYDFAFTRLGSFSRFVDMQTRLSARAHQNLQALGFLPERVKAGKVLKDMLGPTAGRLGEAASAAGAVTVGAGLGAAIGAGHAALSGEDIADQAQMGMAGGAMLGAGGAFRRALPTMPGRVKQLLDSGALPRDAVAHLRQTWKARMESILPRKLVHKIYSDRVKHLTKDEAEQVASLVLHDSWKQVLYDDAVLPLHTVVGRHATGSLAISPKLLSLEERALMKQRTTLLHQLVEFENAGVPAWHPQHLTALLRYRQMHDRLTFVRRQRGPLRDLPQPRVMTHQEGGGLAYEELPEALAKATDLNARILQRGENLLPAPEMTVPVATQIDNEVAGLVTRLRQLKDQERLEKSGFQKAELGVQRRRLEDEIKSLRRRRKGMKDPVPKTVAKPGMAQKPPSYAKDTVSLMKAQNEVRTILQRAAEVTEHDAREALGHLDGSLSKGKRGMWTAKVPGLPEQRGKSLRTVLERIEAFLADTPPMISTTTVGAVAAPAVGFMQFFDPDNKDEGFGFMPSATGAAALAALGIVALRGRGIRFKGVARQFRRIGREATEGRDREGIVVFTDRGELIRHRLGARKSVNQGMLTEHDEARVIASFHNHTMNYPARVASGGTLVRNILPSFADIKALVSNAPRGHETDVVGFVLSPMSKNITIYKLKPEYFAQYADDILRKTQMKHAGDFADALEDAALKRIEDLLREQGYVGFTERGMLWDVASEVIGTNAVVRRVVKDVFEPVGIEVIPNVTDQVLEAYLARAFAATGRTVEEPLVKTLRNLKWEGHPVGNALERLFSPAVRKRLAAVEKKVPKTRKLPPRKAAPAGAGSVKKPLPQTVTAQGVTQMGSKLSAAQKKAREMDMSLNVEDREGVRTFILRVDDDGREVAADTSVGRMRTKVLAEVLKRDAEAAAAEGKVLDAAQTTMAQENSAKAILAGTGAAVGAFTGGIIDGYLGEDESTMDGAFAGLTAGAVIGILAAMKGSGARLTPKASSIVELVMPEVELMTVKEAETLLGKGGVGTPTYVRMPGPLTDGFDYQTEHLVRRLSANANRKRKKRRDKIIAIKEDLRKFTPNVVSLDSLSRIEASILNATDIIGLPRHEAHRLVQGFFNQIAVAPRFRKDTQKLNLLDLDVNKFLGPVSSVHNMAIMKNILANAKIITAGIPDAEAINAGEALMAARRGLRAVVSDDAIRLKAVAKVLDDPAFSPEHAPSTAHSLTLSSILPTERIRSAGQTIRDYGNKEIGDLILNIYDTVVDGLSRISKESEEARAELLSIFTHLHPSERRLVRFIHEGSRDKPAAVWREELAGNTELLMAADKFDVFLKRLAKETGMTEKLMAEEYFAHFYSQRTVREIKKTGLLYDETVTLSESTGIPTVKFFRATQKRRFAEPLGPIIEDPIDVGHIYLNGAIRKKYLDRILHAIPAERLQALAVHEPHVARGIARWIVDIHGIPRPTSVKVRTMMENLGLAFEARFPNMPGWTRALLERYFEKGNPGGLSQMVRSFEFMTKLGFMFTSPLVNLTQMLVNGGADIMAHNLFLGVVTASAGKLADSPKIGPISTGIAGGAAGAGIGYLAGGEEGAMLGAGLGAAAGAGVGGGAKRARKVELTPEFLKNYSFTSPFLDPFIQGRVYRKLAGGKGIYSQAFRKELDRAIKQTSSFAATTEFTPEARSQAVRAAAGFGAIGAGVGAAAPSKERSRAQNIAVGATAGAAFGGLKGFGIAKYIGRRTLQMSTMLFNIAEATNRHVVSAASFHQGKAALRAGKKIAAGVPVRNVMNVERVKQTVETTAVGTAVGAGVGALTATDEDNLGEAVGTGAVVGGMLGAAIGYKSEPLVGRMLDDAARLKEPGNIKRFRLVSKSAREQAIEEGPVTEKEMLEFWMSNHTSMTQFQFGRASRGSALRTPMGESMAALQTYMLNQFEFMGARLTSFMKSVQEGATTYDMRIWRQMLMWMGTGSVMTALYGFGDDQRGLEYWLSRIGMGLMPLVVWNESAQKWTAVNPGAALTGPFLTDATRAAQTFFKLATDPIAQAEWTQHFDDLFKRIIPSLRQFEESPEVLGGLFDEMGMEGLSELMQRQMTRDIATGIGNTLSVGLGREPGRRGNVGSRPAGGLGTALTGGNLGSPLGETP